MRRKQHFIGDDRGATVIEYGLICSLIVIAMLAAFTLFAGATVGMLNYVGNEVAKAS